MAAREEAMALSGVAPVGVRSGASGRVGIALAAILGLACWVRVDRLAAPSFDIDEYLHVFSAQALLREGAPALPSGNLYTRALPYTRVVAQSFRWLGVSEMSARLPSVLFDLLALWLIFLIARAWCSPAAALLAVTVLAFSPWWILDAMNCRMYTMFHAAYLASAGAAWQALEGRGTRRRWLWAVLAGGCLALAVSLHLLAGTLVVGLGLFIAGRAIQTRNRLYISLAAGGLSAAALAVLLGWVDIAGLWERVNTAPAWAHASRYDWGFYLRRWWAMYPVFVLCYPVAMIWAWRRQPALAWFLVCVGLLPFALHSVVFDWKRLRYALYLLPWLVIPVCALLATAIGWLRANVWKTWAAPVALAVALLGAHPWLWQAWTVEEQFPSPPWKNAYDWLQGRMTPSDVVLSSMPLATLYYLGRPASYVMNNVHIQDAGYDTTPGPDGLRRDGYSGLPMITTLEELQAAIARHPRGWITIDQLRFQGKSAMAPGAREYIEAYLTPAPLGTVERSLNPVIMYAWGLSAEAPAEMTVP